MAQLTTSWQRISTISITHGEIRTYAKYSSQSMATNQTTYQIRMTCYANQWFSFSSATANLDGTSKSYGSTRFNAGETTILEVNRTITHNTDGSSPTKNIATSWTATYGGSGSTSANVTFPRINRMATITSAPNFNDEGNPTITYSNPAGNSVSGLKACISLTGARDDIPYRDISKTGTSYTFNLTEEERNILRNACTTSNSRTVKFFIRTIVNGTNLHSIADRTLSIVNANPIFNDFTFEDINMRTLLLTGNDKDIIKGYSKIQTTISTTNKAIAQKGATMVKYRVVNGNSSVDATYNDESNVSTSISNVETGTTNVYAIDSRGNSTMITKLANREINYDAVYTNINNSNFQRDDNRVGDNGVLTLNGTFWNDDFGDVNNSLTVSYRFKKSDSSTWINGTTPIVPTISQNTFSFSGMIASDNADTTWDLQSSYDLEITISDELTTSITNYVLASAVPTLSLDKEGVGIMCQYDTSLGGYLQVNGEPILVPKNEMIIDYTVSANTGTIEFTNLNILPGENYKFRIVGATTGINGDIAMTFNDITTGYYSVGWYNNGTATSSSAELSKNAGYRPNQQRFYYALHMGQYQTIIDGSISIKYNIQSGGYSPLVRWQSQIVWSGHQLLSSVIGTTAGSFTSITKIKLTGVTFRKGTRVQIIKVNGDFTI